MIRLMHVQFLQVTLFEAEQNLQNMFHSWPPYLFCILSAVGGPTNGHVGSGLWGESHKQIGSLKDVWLTVQFGVQAHWTPRSFLSLYSMVRPVWFNGLMGVCSLHSRYPIKCTNSSKMQHSSWQSKHANSRAITRYRSWQLASLQAKSFSSSHSMVSDLSCRAWDTLLGVQMCTSCRCARRPFMLYMYLIYPLCYTP